MVLTQEQTDGTEEVQKKNQTPDFCYCCWVHGLISDIDNSIPIWWGKSWNLNSNLYLWEAENGPPKMPTF